MSYRYYRYRPAGFGLGGAWTPMVKRIIIICVIVFVLQIVARWLGVELGLILGLVPTDIIRGRLWQLGTYIFLHGGPMHLLVNMLFLWMFGGRLEQSWGSRPFLKYFMICGAGAGLITWIFTFRSPIYVVGASGAIFGVLLAYALLFPDSVIYFWFPFPIRAKYLVMIMGGIDLLTGLSHLPAGLGRMGQVGGLIAHLGGLAVGYVYLRGPGLVLRWRRRFGHPWSRTGGKVVDIRRAQHSQRRREIDAILDKISSGGMGSLTGEERRRLREAGLDGDDREG